MPTTRALAALALALLLAAADAATAQTGRGTGLPLPRFVSIDAGEVNVRFGPGEDYPINWVFKQPGIPLEIIAEFDTWRKIRDYEGAEGWVHASLLSNHRTIMVMDQIRELRRTAHPDARVVLRAEPGVIGALLDCQTEWCRVEIAGQRGWLRRNEFWGIRPDEILQ
jgi:SH3-like domain-containing protein